MSGSQPVCPVHVWSIDLDLHSGPKASQMVSREDRDRALRFRFDVDRRRFLASRASLRSLLARYAGVRPGDISFRYGPQGKPELADASSGLRFNVSHSGGRMVIALTWHADIGVDVEQVRPVADHLSLARTVFSEEELDELGAAAEAASAFLRGWTRKEALLKALGTGLGDMPAESAVSLGTPAVVRRVRGGGDARGWTLVDLSGGRHIVALAVHAPKDAVTVRTHHA